MFSVKSRRIINAVWFIFIKFAEIFLNLLFKFHKIYCNSNQEF